MKLASDIISKTDICDSYLNSNLNTTKYQIKNQSILFLFVIISVLGMHHNSNIDTQDVCTKASNRSKFFNRVRYAPSFK